ncbi:carboxypeptidase-like regulatory domain-containing protein [Flavobacterium reichenbachii]|uniref:TonB-dependent receptor n=1 Tax=Flavobacterium reichenbachii TaxID=362418 RepID=A0A085ZNJ6_9FLAO|nr:carboxypeptidase-like regulatory domain-containing protein [Flavobacterium reichenbachii]KFF06010.1 hypothetical protein IW19_10960 [Flavobacterium reichenbachii]OXB14765.1 hypothetical protein B0A68_11980 [Flavobacterium reichenbachii]
MKKLLLLTFLFLTASGFSQNFYYGNVSEDGSPIPGARICVVNTQRCTTSDFDGNYTIEVKIGDQLKISAIGLESTIIRITSQNIQKNDQTVDPILSDDYIAKLKKPTDSIKISKPSGTFAFNLFDGFGEQYLMKINRDAKHFYSLKYKYEYNKLSFEASQELMVSSPIRMQKYQKTYAQGRSQNGELVYQSPETNEIFSWGPNVNSLEYSGNKSEYYPQGNIVNKTFGNGNALELYNPNDFFNNGMDNKYMLNTQIEGTKGNIMRINLTYKTGKISIPTSRNNEIAAFVKYSRNVSKLSKIETILSYDDFENNLTNSNFAVNKIVFANAVTPIHFDNNFASTLSNGLQRSYAQSENNPYYLLQNNVDKNKSKTISFNFNHKYTKDKNWNSASASFQSSEIKNTNGQSFYTAGIAAPNFNERKERFSNFSVSDVFNHTIDSRGFVETKIDFRFQERKLNRQYFTGFAAPIDFPDNSLSQNKFDISQQRFEVFYNANVSYTFRDILSYYEQLVLKANTNLNYSSTVKGKFMPNFLASAEIKDLFNESLSITVSQSYNQVEPSLQNNNLNFNSLRYNVSQFKELQNNLELITPKNAIATQEINTNLSLMYNFDYRWNFNFNFYNKTVDNLYVPSFNLNTINWSPDVNYKENGVEFEIQKTFDRRNLAYSFNLNFTHYKNKVTSLNNNQSSIPFAGFADVNKNYIAGQPLGVIVGNGYLRDNNQNIIIDNDGFPVEDAQPKILGNPNPDFVVGFFNSLKYKNFTLNLSFDWSQGGEMWNGTQQTLNYYGKSELTEQQRNISNYVFAGVTQSGAVNTKTVSFYDANLPVQQNRWTRYGIDGVAEDAIEDATYFRLNAVSLSYTNNPYFNYGNRISYTISLFVNNVFVLSKNKQAFSSNAMFNSLDSSGLEYFNAPMMRSFGSSLTIKF